MITDEERRDVAVNLRNMCMCGCRYKEQFYDLLDETVMNDWDFHGFQDVADRLADLIEPEPERTCTMDKSEFADFAPEYEGLYSCSKCGEQTAVLACVNEDGDMEWIKPRSCGFCGAKVVNATDGA